MKGRVDHRSWLLLLVLVCLMLYGCSSEPSDLLDAGSNGDRSAESRAQASADAQDVLLEDSLDQIVAPDAAEAALSRRTSFVLVDEDGFQIAAPEADGRRWTVQAWTERSGEVSFTTEFHHFVQDGSDSLATYSCAFNSGLIVGDSVAGYRYFEGRRPNVAQPFDNDGFACDEEPRLLSEEEALFADVFLVAVVHDGFEVTSSDGQVLRLLRRDL